MADILYTILIRMLEYSYMAGSNENPRWYNTAHLKFTDALATKDFKTDIDLLRSELAKDPFELHGLIMFLMDKYSLPRGVYGLIRHYALEGEVGTDPDIVNSPVLLLSSKDQYVGPGYEEIGLQNYLAVYPDNYVRLELTGEIKKTDLIDFINLNWKLIESKLKLIEPNSIGVVKGKQVGRLHAEVLRLNEEGGKSYKEIAYIMGLTTDNVSKILHRLRIARKK